MSQQKYSDVLLESYENALGREATVIGESDGPDGTPSIELALFPSDDRNPVAKLTTLGMSRDPLAHPDHDDLHVELAMSFPSAWRPDGSADSQWPIHELLKWATYPLLQNIFLWKGQTLTSEPLQQLGPDVDFCGWLAADPSFVPESATTLTVDGRQVYLIDLIPLYREELDFAAEQSTDALLERLQENRTPPLVTAHRANVCA